MKQRLGKFITYGLYPFLLFSTLTTIYLAINFHLDYKSVYGITTLVLVITLVVTETLFPLSGAWSMTKRSFWRDLRYILIDAPIIGITKTAFGWLSIYYCEKHTALIPNRSILLNVIVYLLVFEFFQYWYHRLSHTGKGKIGKFLWRVHVAHHLPDKVYVVMHAVFNPINAFITTSIIQLPLILLGVSPEVAFAATLLIDLQSVISHFNVDIKAGILNYVFIGTETHRYHHSADPGDVYNYGNTLAIWDILFGTFNYKPRTFPKSLGVINPSEYPASEKVLDVIRFPFKRDY